MPTTTNPTHGTDHPSACHAWAIAGPELSHRDVALRVLAAAIDLVSDNLHAAALIEVAESFAYLDKAHDAAEAARTYCKTNAAACTTTANEYADHARTAWRDLDDGTARTPAELIEQRDVARYYEREGARLDGMARGYLDARRAIGTD